MTQQTVDKRRRSNATVQSLFIANFPRMITRRLRAKAALAGITTREVIILELAKAVGIEEDLPADAAAAGNYKAEIQQREGPPIGDDVEAALAARPVVAKKRPPRNKMGMRVCEHGKGEGFACWECGGKARAL